MRPKYSIYLLIVIGLIALAIGVRGQCGDPAYRRAKNQFIQQLPSNVQAKIWRNHIRFAIREENPNDYQRAILDEGLALVRDDTYTPLVIGINKLASLDYARRAAEAFPDKAQYARIFAFLTPEELRGYSIVKASYKRLTSDEGGNCSCNHYSAPLCDQCWWSGNAYPMCTGTQSGCGPFWILECDGRCEVNGQIQ